RNQLNAEAEAVQIILTGIDNDIYSTVGAACEMNKVNLSMSKILKPISFGNLESSRHWMENRLNHIIQELLNKNASICYRKREKAVVNSPQPIYDHEPSMVDDDEDTSKEKEIDKLMALFSLSFKKIYKPTNNNLRTSSNTSRANQDN
nr:hypothetical protein [Tanacetum cinerariifolium]